MAFDLDDEELEATREMNGTKRKNEMELEEAIKTLQIIANKSDEPFKFAIETVLQELENRVPKKKIKDVKSKYEEKYEKHKSVADKQFEELGTRDCFDNDLAIEELGAIRVCEELLEEK